MGEVDGGVAVGGERAQRIEHRRAIVGDGVQVAEGQRPDAAFEDVQGRHQGHRHRHHHGEGEGDVAAAVPHRVEHLVDPGGEDRQAEDVDDAGQGDQRHAPRPVLAPLDFVERVHAVPPFPRPPA